MTGWQVGSVVFAFPAGLAVLLAIIAQLEARFIAPDERAEQLHGALETTAEPNDVEELAARLVRQAMPVAGMRARPARRAQQAPHAGARPSTGRTPQREAPRLDTSQRVA